MVRKQSILIAAGLAIFVVGCAGNSLKVDQTLSKELSKDLKEKFEVREVSQGPKPTPSATPSLIGTKSSQKKKSSHKKTKMVQAAHFVYPNRRPEKEPIWIGEKLTYEVTYLGMPAGDFSLEALPFKMVGNRKVYHIQAKAWSSKIFSLIYKLEDWVETYIDYEGFFSHRFELHQDETKQLRDSLELYDSEKKQSYWWNRWDRKERGKSENKDFYSMEPFPQDTLSSIYYLRTVPLTQGSTVVFPVMSEGKPLDAYVTVVKRERMSTPLGDIMTIKVKPEAATRGVLERKGDSFMWFSDDDRRFLVRIEAKVRIGTVVARLKKVELGTAP